MKFDRFKFLSAWDWIYILPTIEVHWDEQIYLYSNFSIEIHWLGWHAQWRWFEKGGQATNEFKI